MYMNICVCVYVYSYTWIWVRNVRCVLIELYTVSGLIFSFLEVLLLYPIHF